MNFDITPTSPTPIYRQIVEQVRLLIASGQLRAGDELPSVRALASLHAINPMTVSKAYSLLEADKVLSRRRGVGMVVADTDTDSAAPDKLALLRPALLAAAQIARQLHIDDAAALAAFASCLNEGNNHEPDDAI